MLRGRRLLPDAGLAFLLIGGAALLLYAGSFGYPLVFDSVAWFRQDNLRALGNLASTDRYVSKTVTYWLYRLLDERIELLRAAHLALHVTAAFLVFLLFRRLMEFLFQRRHFGPALAVAVLFVLHPVQVYAVADLGQMELVLATLFGLVMLLAYLEALLRRGDRTLPLWHKKSSLPSSAGFLTTHERRLGSMPMGLRTLRQAVLVVLVLMPGAAWAGLAGDTVHVTLTDLDTLTNIIDANGIVLTLGPPEFSGPFVQGLQTTSWTLDMLDNGFVLRASCGAGADFCSYPSGLRLLISSLDFTPPADLTGLATSSG